MLSQRLITIGLSCDVVGAVLVLIFALPSKLKPPAPAFLLLEGKDPKDYALLGLLGAALLVGGFGLQIWGVWV